MGAQPTCADSPELRYPFGEYLLPYLPAAALAALRSTCRYATLHLRQDHLGSSALACPLQRSCNQSWQRNSKSV